MARRTARSVSESIVKLSGNPVYLGTIDYAATSKTNHQATTPFANAGNALLGKIILMQPSTDVYIRTVLTNSGTVDSTNGILILANERVQIVCEDIDGTVLAGESYRWLAAIRSTASGNLKVWELL